MKLGVCYYPEHWPVERWPEDARLMRQAGLTYVRIGEFAWAQMEPAEGQYDWAWLDKVIDILDGEALQVVLCTPTAAPPAWLANTYPQILPVDAQFQVRRFGSRRHYCHNSPIFREHTRRIVTAMASRYGKKSQVVGWQIDNEFGCYDTARCYCDRCVTAFRAWLKARYGSLENLNETWGAAFWSQVYTDWGQIDPPIMTVAEPNPSHVLDYWRFSSASVRDYQQIQIDILKKYSPGKFVTHNFIGDLPYLDVHDMAQSLDFVCWDSYPTGYAEKSSPNLYASDETRPACDYDVGDPYVTGFCHDLTRGVKQAPYWVMEQQCGNINWSDLNTGVRPGAVKLWTWHAFASGAEAVVYFRWRACRYGFEQYHSGLLNHDGSLATGYHDVCDLATESWLVDKATKEPRHCQVALLLDYNDLWAIQLQPHRKDFGYFRHLFRYYRALASLGIQVDIVPPRADLSEYKLVIAPTLFMADEELASRLSAFVEADGVLLLGVRSGFKMPSNVVTDLPLPGALRSLVGARVLSWQALPPKVGYALGSDTPGLDGMATFWAEALEPDEAEVLARYTDGPFAGKSALTARRLGKGRVLYIGWYPDLAQAQALLAHLAAQVGAPAVPGLPEGVISIWRGDHLVLLNFRAEIVRLEVNGRMIEIPPRSVAIDENAEGGLAT